MYAKLWKHDWIKLKRSAFLTQKIGENILLGFFGLYFGAIFLIIGFQADKIIKEIAPDLSVLEFANKYLLYYLLVDFVIRVLFQKFPGIEIQKYLTLNIKKAQLVRFVTIKSMLSFFNIAPLLLFVPFVFSSLAPEVGMTKALIWLGMIFWLIILNHFFAFFIVKNFQKKAYLSLLIMIVVAASLFLDYNNWLSLTSISEPLFSGLSYNIFPVLFLIVKVGSSAFVVYKLLLKNTFLDQGGFEQKQVNTRSYGIFKAFGPEVGQMMEMESKLIWRNKRTKTFLIISFLFLLYPLLFRSNEFLDNVFFKYIICLMLTGAFMINYGQLFISWNSGHFEFLLSKNVRIKSYLKAKVMLLFLSNTILFLFSLCYLLIYPDYLTLLVACYLFNSGVILYLYMFTSISTAKKIDINRKGMMNHEGLGFVHYILLLPVLFLPVALHYLFSYLGLPQLGLLFIGLVGIIGIIFRDYILGIAEQQLLKRKYILNARFKE